MKDYNSKNRTLVDLIPSRLRNEMNVPLMENIFDRMYTAEETIPLFGFIGKKTSGDVIPKIQQIDSDRDINTLIPTYTFANGTKNTFFTPHDFMLKLKKSGVDSPEGWLRSVGNNLIPPISLDKFVNFYDYYWVANALPSVPIVGWNNGNDPEYYVIQRPAATDKIKLNANVASPDFGIIRTGSGYHDLDFVVNFTDELNFTITATGNTAGISELTQHFSLSIAPTDTSGAITSVKDTIKFVDGGKTLVSLVFNRDLVVESSTYFQKFASGDKFTVTVSMLKSSYFVSFNGSTSGSFSRGGIANVVPLMQFQTIDGVTLKEGDRVLVTNGSDSGIFRVTRGDWIKELDSVSITDGDTIFVKSGITNGGFLFQASVASSGTTWVKTSTTKNNTNDWQEHNYWVNKKVFDTDHSYDLSKVVQATRPIIEFDANLELSANWENGVPLVGDVLSQSKAIFNQIPLFNLYLYDGTFSGKVSPIFFYVEDPLADIDLHLQRRVKMTDNADFIFNHALETDKGLLFFKKSGVLCTIWSPGYQSSNVTNTQFDGTGNGTIDVFITDDCEQQVLTLTAISSDAFSCESSKYGVLSPSLKIGDILTTPFLTCRITAGSTSFVLGDKFRVMISGQEFTRNVVRNSDDKIFSSLNSSGTIMYPRMFSHNPLNQNSGEIAEGSMYGHFRSILQNQINDHLDVKFGGSIKSWNAPVSLLSSMLMQDAISLDQLVDFGQRQYENASNTVCEVFFTNILGYLSSVTGLADGIFVEQLTDFILQILVNDANNKTILGDSSSGVPGFPLTLAQMRLIERQMPEKVFDGVLSEWFIKHHDGHLNPAYRNDVQFQDLLFDRTTRSVYKDLITNFQNHAPTPEKGKVWRFIENGENKTKVFCADVLSTSAPSIYENGKLIWAENAVWADPSSNKVYRFDSTSLKWTLTTQTFDSLWIQVDFAELLNQVILEVETRLYNNVETFKAPIIDVAKWDTYKFSAHMEKEFAQWAFSNKLDPLASVFNAKDSFSWNFSKANVADIAPIAASVVPARWFDILVSHQSTVAGVIPTIRPDLEPWKLMGFPTKPSTWDSKYAGAVRPGTVTKIIDAVAVDDKGGTPFGLRVIDGVMLKTGDLVVITNSSVSSENYVWQVSGTSWTKFHLSYGEIVKIKQGQIWSNTEWGLTTTGDFAQFRMWSSSMWRDIKALHASLRLSVNTANDLLLPPYVNPGISISGEALTNVIPKGSTLPYSFGQNSPVESIWVRSIDFLYSIARAMLKTNPLGVIELLWGYEVLNLDGLKLDGQTLKPFSISNLAKHGASVSGTNRIQELTFSGIMSLEDVVIEISYVGILGNSRIFKLVLNGKKHGYFAENTSVTINPGDVVEIPSFSISYLNVEDFGIPFKHGDTFKIQYFKTGSVVTSFIPASSTVIIGIGQWFAQAQRDLSIDSDVSASTNAMYNWVPHLSYRVGGFIVDDDFTVSTTLNSLPASAFNLVTKKTQNFDSSWITALRVSITQFGSNKKMPEGGYKPTNNGEDWVFRIEGYNSRNLEIEYYKFDKTGNYHTFNALEKSHVSTDWIQYTDTTSLSKVVLPVTIVGLQNVINFIFGYQARLEENGWDFTKFVPGSVDYSGRVSDFQLMIERMIDGIYAGTELGRGMIINPIANGVHFNHPVGLLSAFNTHIQEGHSSAIFDIFGKRIPTEDLIITRSKQHSLIAANTPVFSAFVSLDTYEHLLVFNDFIIPSTKTGILYSAFEGAIVSNVTLNGKRQANTTLRPEIGGFVLNGDTVVPNIERTVSSISKMYDTNHVFEDTKTSTHALALLGYTPKPYMNDMDYHPKTQFNFWRGMVHSKGTNLSFNAFVGGNRFDDAKLDEYWAYKIADYGDSRTKIFPDLLISNGDCQQNFSRFVFNTQTTDNFISVSTTDEKRWVSNPEIQSIESFDSKLVKRINLNVSAEDVVNGVLYYAPKVGDYTVAMNLEKVNNYVFKAVAEGNAYIEIYSIDADKHTPLKLIDYVDHEVVQTIPYWNPEIGAHNPHGDVGVHITSKVDPARYNYSTIINGNANFDPYRAWGKNEVGRVWWDTTNLEYLPYNDPIIFPQIEDRLNRWGVLSERASIDVVEWVESDFTPSEYEAISIAGSNPDVDGRPYGAKNYYRNRKWFIAPIAWSRSGVPNENAHPSFAASYNDILTFRASGIATLEFGTFAGYGISEGMRIGAWRDDAEATKPLNEFYVTGDSTKFFIKDDTEFFGETFNLNGGVVNVELLCSTHTDVVGFFEMFHNTVSDDTTELLYSGDTKYSTKFRVIHNSIISVVDFVSVTPSVGSPATISFIDGQTLTIDIGYGLSAKLTFNVGLTATGAELADALVAVFINGVTVQDAVVLREVTVGGLTPTVDLINPLTLANDPTLPENAANNGIGWRAWTVPTQAELDADTAQPNSVWKPYIGDFIENHSPTLEFINDIIANGSLTLNDGTEITRFKTEWADWVEINDTVQTIVAISDTIIADFGIKLDSKRTSVYRNGILQGYGAYTITGNFVTIETLNVGDTVVIVYAGYTPSKKELAFNPDVSDDLTIQRHYKKDYQFVEVPIRSSDGAIINSKYYFWVSDKSHTVNSISVKTIAENLKNGPAQYVTFFRFENETTINSIVVYGLNYIVSKNDTFQLRLVNDQTLRDDPEGLNLKDTHSEWALIRRGQRTRCPKQLWDKIVESMCGETIVGDTLPAVKLQEFDIRNGTTTIYGFNDGQILAPSEVLVNTIQHTILNTTVIKEFDVSNTIDFIADDVLDWSDTESWFVTPSSIRKNMDSIWNKARPQQINEIVFNAIEDICAHNPEMTHLMKTSRLSAYSIKIVPQVANVQEYD